MAASPAKTTEEIDPPGGGPPADILANPDPANDILV